MAYYSEHAQQLKRDLAAEVPTDELRELHAKRPVLHALIAFLNVAVLVAAGVAIVHLDRWYLWLPFAVVAGFAVFDFTVLLHEVVHRAVLAESSERAYRVLGLLYAVPSGISASQFTRWHLDHHAALGSDIDDPKRHYLSPKKNARWLKALYFTPALFPIYFRAAAKETAAYEPELQRRIARERLFTIAFQLAVLAAIALIGGWAVAFKLYIVPVFFIFPIAFALNRLGQHYDIDPADPAKWSTLIKGSWFWDIAYLYSNYHLEHHYFPGVPFYNLPRLQKLLMPFYKKRGMTPLSYGTLLWGWLVLNRKPHAKWDERAGEWCRSRRRSRIAAMTSFSIDLGDETATALREIAQETAESPDAVIRRAIEELVADYIDGRVAMQRLADPSDAVISSEEMWRSLEED